MKSEAEKFVGTCTKCAYRRVFATYAAVLRVMRRHQSFSDHAYHIEFPSIRRVALRPRKITGAIHPSFSAKAKCRRCGKRFRTLPSRASDPRRGSFCSRTCWREWVKEKIPKAICTNCKRRFLKKRPPSHLKRGDKRIFCSKECFQQHNRTAGNPLVRHWWFKTNYPHKFRQTKEWALVATEVCVRALGRCEVEACLDNPRKLHVHHIVPLVLAAQFVEKNPNEPINLIAVCAACHAVFTVAEHDLSKGDLLSYLERLRKAHFPTERIREAFAYFEINERFLEGL